MDSPLFDVIALPALLDNYIWTIINSEASFCVVVDPGEATPVTRFLQQRNCQLAGIMITHHHFDHTGGVAELVSQYPNVPVFGPALEAVDGMTILLDDGDEVIIPSMNLHFTAMHIPGHTLGHIALYGHGLVFSGDT
ncbi:MAG: MBL fold metallo-hydrolase, partial [Coxiellaceae bacterium]|nr:MBL fold metallo-hydrolase [Coxiellaceae bacterium]